MPHNTCPPLRPTHSTQPDKNDRSRVRARHGADELEGLGAAGWRLHVLPRLVALWRAKAGKVERQRVAAVLGLPAALN